MKAFNPHIYKTFFLHTAKNIAHRIPGMETLLRSVLGSPFGAGSLDEKYWQTRRMAQIRQLLNAYVKAWDDVGWLHDKVVVELGSGDDISVPFTFAVLGASKAYATDVPNIESIALGDNLKRAVTSMAEDFLPQQNIIPSGQAEKLVERKSNIHAENLANAFPNESIDLIVSTSTLEHVFDPAASVAEMFRTLRNGGRMIHAIAMGNHCCGSGEQDKLGHLYYSDRVWKLMFSHRVGHNRLRWFEWEQVLKDAGFKIVGCEFASVPAEQIAQSRPYLASRFAHMSDEQLGPSYAVVSCEKIADRPMYRDSQ